MREMPEQLTYFQQYAERKLKDHIDELESHYVEEVVGLESRHIAYTHHQKIYEEELLRKIDQLAPADFDYVRLSLWGLKDIYAGRLSVC